MEMELNNKICVILVSMIFIFSLVPINISANMGNEHRPLLPIDLIRNNFDWRLQGKHPVSGEWINCTEQMGFEFWYQEDDSVKINITFNFPYRTDYRLDIVINKRVLQYVEHEGQYNYSINYSDIKIYFNFYDMVIHSDELQHGIIEYDGKDCLWVRFIKFNIQGLYTIDPTIGFTGTSTFYTAIKNEITGMYHLYPTHDMLIDKMFVYTKDLMDFGATRKMWVALYEYDGANYELMGENDRTFLAGGFLPSWKSFKFNNSVYINKNKMYALTVQTNLNTALYRDEIFPPIRYWIGESITYDNYNNPWTTFSYLGNRDWCIYASGVYVEWETSDILLWKIINQTNIPIFRLSESGNVSIAGTLYENTITRPPDVNIVYIINNSFWLTENGDLYIKDVLCKSWESWGYTYLTWKIYNTSNDNILSLSSIGKLGINGILFEDTI